jgi:hypothetical protein
MQSQLKNVFCEFDCIFLLILSDFQPPLPIDIIIIIYLNCKWVFTQWQ